MVKKSFFPQSSTRFVDVRRRQTSCFGDIDLGKSTKRNRGNVKNLERKAFAMLGKETTSLAIQENGGKMCVAQK